MSEDLYEKAFDEIESGQYVRGLWAKCFAQCGGDSEKAKAMYITERVDRLQTPQTNGGAGVIRELGSKNKVLEVKDTGHTSPKVCEQNNKKCEQNSENCEQNSENCDQSDGKSEPSEDCPYCQKPLPPNIDYCPDCLTTGTDVLGALIYPLVISICFTILDLFPLSSPSGEINALVLVSSILLLVLSVRVINHLARAAKVNFWLVLVLMLIPLIGWIIIAILTIDRYSSQAKIPVKS